MSRNRDGDFGRVDPDAVIRGEAVAEEYRVLVDEGRKSENRGLGNESIGVRVPSRTGVDETAYMIPISSTGSGTGSATGGPAGRRSIWMPATSSTRSRILRATSRSLPT